METSHETITIYNLDHWHYEQSEDINNLFSQEKVEDLIYFLQSNMTYDPFLKNGRCKNRCWGYDGLGKNIYYLDEYTIINTDELFIYKNEKLITLTDKVIEDCKNKFKSCFKKIVEFFW